MPAIIAAVTEKELGNRALMPRYLCKKPRVTVPTSPSQALPVIAERQKTIIPTLHATARQIRRPDPLAE